MIEILLAIIFGFVLGIVTGILPGLHPNNIIPMVLGLSFAFNSISLSIVLLIAGIVNIFVNFIPSIFVGAPEDSTSLSVLPGHRMLMEGRGFEAIKLTSVGCLGGILVAIAILPLFALIIPFVYGIIRPQTHWILISAVGLLMLGEKSKLKSLIVFALAGVLGIIVLETDTSNLFPMLSGLFGVPTLLLSIKSKIIPKVMAETKSNALKRDNLLSPIGIGSIAGIVAGLLPGLGAAQSTALTQRVFKNKMDHEKFLISIGAVSTSDLIYSVLALWLIGNPRSGIAVAIGQLIQLDVEMTLLFLGLAVVAAFISYKANMILAKNILKILSRVNYSKLCLATLTFISLLIFLFTGFFGLLILLVSTTVGLMANIWEIRRSNCMGCLLVPTILFFIGVSLS